MKKLLLFLTLNLAYACYVQTTINNIKMITCKLTSKEMQKRKETVIASLINQVIEKKELKNGYTYQFKGSDSVISELTEFVKTERLCCDFFDFTLRIKGDQTSVWLEISGPDGTKKFIKTELEF